MGERNTLTDRQKNLLEYLKNRSRATKKQMLSGLPYDEERTLRKDIEALREFGYPICYDNLGYIYTEDMDRIDRTIDALIHHANGLLRTAKTMTKIKETIQRRNLLADNDGK